MDDHLLTPPKLSSASSNGNVIAVIMAMTAAIGPLTFGYTLGFTSPGNLSMEAGAKTSPWLFGALFTGVTADDTGAIASGEASLFGSLVNGARPPTRRHALRSATSTTPCARAAQSAA